MSSIWYFKCHFSLITIVFLSVWKNYAKTVNYAEDNIIFIKSIFG